MIIEQLYTNCLAEAAYYIESEGEAAIIDPLRETQQYIDKANRASAKIKFVFETHFHADFVSGHVDLAKQTGATIVFGPTATTNFDAHIAVDNEEFKIGKLTIKVLHTPGHTPESVTFLLLDENKNPYCIFSGDTLFIGDVGRPDLAVKSDLTKEDLAALLYDSLRQKIMTLPDNVLVYPAHGAGSACGKNMSSDTYDTLGNQKKTNYALAEDLTKEDFIKEVTTGILPPPQYFPKAVLKNKNGYVGMKEIIKQSNQELDVNAFIREMEDGALILDTRNKDDFKLGFIPGSLFIGIDGSFAVWVGTLIEDMNQRIIVLADEGKASEVVTRLARVGYDNCRGYLKGGIKAWTDQGGLVDTIDSLEPDALMAKSSELNASIIDVRKPSEYDADHVEGAILYPLDFINDHLTDLNKDQKYIIHCRSGYRSIVAITILKQQGYEGLYDLTGGMQAILKTTTPVVAKACENLN